MNRCPVEPPFLGDNSETSLLPWLAVHVFHSCSPELLPKIKHLHHCPILAQSLLPPPAPHTQLYLYPAHQHWMTIRRKRTTWEEERPGNHGGFSLCPSAARGQPRAAKDVATGAGKGASLADQALTQSPSCGHSLATPGAHGMPRSWQPIRGHGSPRAGGPSCPQGVFGPCQSSQLDLEQEQEKGLQMDRSPCPLGRQQAQFPSPPPNALRALRFV